MKERQKPKISFKYEGVGFNAVSVLGMTEEQLAQRHKECKWPGTAKGLQAAAEKAKAAHEAETAKKDGTAKKPTPAKQAETAKK